MHLSNAFLKIPFTESTSSALQATETLAGKMTSINVAIGSEGRVLLNLLRISGWIWGKTTTVSDLNKKAIELRSYNTFQAVQKCKKQHGMVRTCYVSLKTTFK